MLLHLLLGLFIVRMLALLLLLLVLVLDLLEQDPLHKHNQQDQKNLLSPLE